MEIGIRDWCRGFGCVGFSTCGPRVCYVFFLGLVFSDCPWDPHLEGRKAFSWQLPWDSRIIWIRFGFQVMEHDVRGSQ